MKKIFSLFFVIIAGEAIFMLPFLLPRLLRPLMMQTWQITNTDIGLAFSAYGVSSLFSYLFGGALADKYSPKKLISISLIATSLVGSCMLFSPSPKALIGIYFVFGISTTFLLWGALIKLTHLTGGESKRSTAMGLLDSGRGLFAAVMSSIMLYVISIVSSLASEQVYSLNAVIAILAIVVLIIGCLVWIFVEDPVQSASSEKWNFILALQVLKNPRVWIQGIIILCAYCGFKNIDNYSVYLVDVHKQSILDSSKLTSYILWVRPISTLLFGIVADYLFRSRKNGRFYVTIFLFLGASILNYSLGMGQISVFSMIFSSILISVGLVFALRSLYFAIFDELKIAPHLIGTSVGIISVLGFLPDMFFGLVTGHIIDTQDASDSYSLIFTSIGSILLLGAIASFVNMKISKSTKRIN